MDTFAAFHSSPNEPMFVWMHSVKPQLWLFTSAIYWNTTQKQQKQLIRCFGTRISNDDYCDNDDTYTCEEHGSWWSKYSSVMHIYRHRTEMADKQKAKSTNIWYKMMNILQIVGKIHVENPLKLKQAATKHANINNTKTVKRARNIFILVKWSNEICERMNEKNGERTHKRTRMCCMVSNEMHFQFSPIKTCTSKEVTL